MKWWKQAAKGAAVFVLASALTACGVVSSGNETADNAKKKDDKIVIGFSLDTLKEERWQHDKEMFEAKAKELGAEVKNACGQQRRCSPAKPS